MANTTFSGPVISKNGFINTGTGMTGSLTSDDNFNCSRSRWQNFTYK